MKIYCSDDYHCSYPKPLSSGGGVPEHLELDICILVLVRQELVLKCLLHLVCKFALKIHYFSESNIAFTF